MALDYGIRQPLRIYEKLEHQNRFRKGGDVAIFNNIAPTNYIPPFQIKKDVGVFSITGIKYISVKDSSEIDLFNSLGSNQLDKYAFANYDYLVHFGDEEHTALVPVGEYYLEITDSVNTWYSEVLDIRSFDVDNLSLSDCVLTKITYWDTCDVADIFYRTLEYGNGLNAKQYKNIVYLDTGVGKPNYEYSEEGEEDGLGNFSPDYKKLEKEYVVQGVYPEYFVDALALIPLHVGGSGVIEILTNKGYTGTVDRFTVTPEWQDDLGVWALTDLIFSTEFIVKTNCCGALDAPLTTCLRNSVEFVAELLEGSDDYNNFEYTDATDGTTKIPLVDNDLVLVENLSGVKLLKTYDETNSEYDPYIQIFSDGNAATDTNKLNGFLTQPYHFFVNGSGFIQDPTVDTFQEDATTGRWIIQGKTWSESLVEVIVNTNTGEVIVAQDTGQNYIDNGILFDIPINGISAFVRCIGLTCTLGESANQNFTGIGFMAIENNFIVT